MADLAGRRILVVEDEALVAMLIEDALTEAGATVIGPTRSVESALFSLAQGRIDAAVLDLNLAGVMSTVVAIALSERGIPFVVASGYGDSQRCEMPPAAARLAKPYLPRDLISVLATIFEAGSSSTTAA